MNFISLIPLPWRLLAVALVLACLFAVGFKAGAGHVQAKWDKAVAAQVKTVAAVKQDQAAGTVQVVTQYVDRVQIVRQKGADIIKEVPVYVSPESDAACAISRGFVRLHDAAAAGHLPDPAGSADAGAAGVALSAVAGTVADNYQRCHENAEQLMALQAWVGRMNRSAELKD